MRIGIDCRTILNPESGERAGVGHYTYHLVKALLADDTTNTYVLFFDHRMALEGTQEFEQPNVEIHFFPFSSYGKFLPIAYSQLLTAAKLQRAKLDVFHAPANVIPLNYRQPSVLTIHDLAIYAHPEWFPRQRISTRVLVPRSVKRAKQIIAVSESTKHDLIKLFSVPAEKVSVVPEAVDVRLLPLQDADDDVRALYQLPEHFVLFVGTIEPRKNLPRLLQAWQEIKTNYPDVTSDVELILAGGYGYRGSEQLQLLSTVPGSRHLNYVSHNHKIKLIQEASALVFPSLYEGFGLPVLEAMTLGTPVISTTTSSIPEVTGQSAVLVDPMDVHALGQGIVRVLKDPRYAADLAERGRQQAAKFTWLRAADATKKVYRQAAT